MGFDARTVKMMEDGSHLTIDGCPGLRIVARGLRRTWTYRYKSPIDGNMRQIKIGLWPAMPLPAAMVEWDALRARRDAGEDLAVAKREAVAVKPAAVYTVRQLCDDYLSGHVDRHRKARGAAEMRRLLGAHLGAIEDRPACDITRADAFALLESLVHIPVTAQTLRGELGAAWEYALDAGRLAPEVPNWWRLVMRGRLRSIGRQRAGESIGAGKRVLSDKEIGELVRWLPKFSPLVSDVLTLYLWTGTRGSEIVAMEPREITQEPDGWWWTIPKAKTKNARHEGSSDLRVPLVGRALAVVQRRTGEKWLFPATLPAVGHVKQQVIGSQVYNHQPYAEVHPDRARERLTVAHWSPHDLRRTVRTQLAAMGCPDSVAEAVLGHMQAGIKGTYNKYSYDAERREWLTQLADRLESLSCAPCSRAAKNH